MTGPFRASFSMPTMSYSCGCTTPDQLHLSLRCCYRRGNGIHGYAVREDCCACCRNPKDDINAPPEPVKHDGPCHFTGARP